MKTGWMIEETSSAQKMLAKAPRQVRQKYEFWKEQIEDFGPLAVRVNTLRGFRDHALKGKWLGCRSSYLNDQYRVVYRLEKNVGKVLVEKIGPHNY